MKKKVLLVGEKYSSNLGDGVICEVVENVLQNDDFEVINFDISGRSGYFENVNEFNFKKENLVYIKSKIKKILSIFGYKKMGKNFHNIYEKFKENFDNIVSNKKIDSVVFAGGQMFIDTFIYQIDYICQYCEKNNINIIFNCCGGGKILNESLLKKVLNYKSIRYISVRDNYEKLKILSNKKIINCYDSAILASDIYKINREPEFEYGIGIMFSTLQSPKMQIDFLRKMLNVLIDNNVKFKIFTNGSYKDYSFAKFILSEVNLNEDVYLMERPTTPMELVNIILRFKKILSMRLHSMIIAYSYNIPSISISWDNKVNIFFEKIGLKNNCYTLKSRQEEILEKLFLLDNECINEKIKEKIYSDINNNFKCIKNIINEKKVDN